MTIQLYEKAFVGRFTFALYSIDKGLVFTKLTTVSFKTVLDRGEALWNCVCEMLCDRQVPQDKVLTKDE